MKKLKSILKSIPVIQIIICFIVAWWLVSKTQSGLSNFTDWFSEWWFAIILILALIGFGIWYFKFRKPSADTSKGGHNGIWNFLIVVFVVIFAVWFIRTKPWEPSGKDYTVYATPNDWSEKLMLADNGNYYKIVCHCDPGEEIIVEYTRRESDGQLYSYTQRYAYGQKFDLPPSLYYRVMSANGKSFDVTYTKTVWRT